MEFGKFKSADELLKGYNELEKSFTQKCQQLSDLQQMINNGGTNELPSPPDEEQLTDTVPTQASEDATCGGAVSCSDSSAQEATFDENVLQQYFKQNPSALYRILQASSKSTEQQTPPPVMTGGGNASMALPSRPKTIREASQLAEKLFK